MDTVGALLPTITVPNMNVKCGSQWYGYVPAASKVRMHMPPCERSWKPQIGSWAVLPVTVCWTRSVLTQTIVSPGRMVIDGGLKEEPWMVLV